MKFSRILLATLVFTALSACMSHEAAAASDNVIGYTYSGGTKTAIYLQSPDKSDGNDIKSVSIDELIRRAGNNDVEAVHILGMRYIDGNGVERDKDLGFSMVKKAADQGYAPAECDLGFLYYVGRGTNVDFKKAFELFSRAADKGHAVAQNNVGAMYNNGIYVHKSITKAISWYKKAARQGNITAQRNLGELFETGDEGIQKNPSEAAKWYRMAAEQGDEKSIKALSRLNIGPKSR